MTATALVESVANLDVSRALHSDPRRLCEALTDPSWLGQVVAPPPGRPDLIRVESDLAFILRNDGREVSFKKAALIDIGMSPAIGLGCVGEISWRASSFSPLFPVFAGRLSISGNRIELHGVYAPPGGQLGVLIDKTMIHGFAEKTARWLLDKIVAEFREREIAERRGPRST
jgi:hypothetical protein